MRHLIKFPMAAAMLLMIAVLLSVVTGASSVVFGAVPSSLSVDESFDNYPSGTLSGANWGTTTASGSVMVEEDASNANNKSVKITKTNMTGTVNADRKNISLTGQLVVDYRVKSDEVEGNKSAPYINNATQTGVNISLDAGSIKAYNGTTNAKLQAFTAGTWYQIQLVLDTNTSKFDMYVDGKLVASQFSFRTTGASPLTYIRFAIGSNQVGTVSFDDLRVTEVPTTIELEAPYGLVIGHTHTSKVTSNYPDGTSGDVTKAAWYDSSNTAIAQVDAKGVVTAKGIGSAVITAHYAGKTTSTIIEVASDVVLNGLQMDAEVYSIQHGSERATVVTAVYSNGLRNVTAAAGYSSNNPSIATVSGTGLVTGKSPGTTVITATYGGKSASATVTVIPVLTKLQLDTGVYSLHAGASHKTVVSAVYSDQSVRDVSLSSAYMSTNSSVAWVDRAGTVTGVSAGTSVITATYGGKSVSSNVAVSSVKLDSDGYVLQPGTIRQTNVLLQAPDGSELNVSGLAGFSSSNPAVAEVDAAGKVTGKKDGSTVITAVYGQSRAVANVTVSSTGYSSQVIVPSTGKGSLQVHLWALGADPVYGIQSGFDFDPTVLKLEGIATELFEGDVIEIDAASLVNVDGKLTGFRSVTVQGSHIAYAATRIGLDAASGAKPYATLKFKVLNASQDTQLQISGTAAAALAGNSIVQAALTGVTATFDSEPPPAGGDTIPPSAPVVSVSGKTQTSVSLGWTEAADNVGVVGYKVYVNNGTAAAATVTGLTYTFTGLMPSTSYTFVVKAVDAAGNIKASNEVSVKTDSSAPPLDTIPPSAPVVSVSGKTQTSVSLSWTEAKDNVGVVGYKVYVNNGTAAAATVTGLTYTLTGLMPGTSYTFVVKAVDAAGNLSEGAAISVLTSTYSSNHSNGGGGSAPVGPQSEDKQNVKLTDLKPDINGKFVLEMGIGKKQLMLPVEAINALKSQSGKLEIQSEKGTVSIPLDILKSLTALLGSEAAAKDAQISFILSAMDKQSAESMAASALKTKDALVKSVSEVLRFELSIFTKDGVEKKLPFFNEPIEIKIPYVGSSGLKEQLLGVYYLNEQTKEWEYVGGRIDAVNKQITVKLSHFSVYTVLEYNKTYIDVPSGHWGFDAVNVLSAKHIVNGIDAEHFAPTASTTRAEFAALLVRSLGLSAKAAAALPFNDVPSNAWYTEAVAAAYEAKLIGGRTAATFAPDDKLSREEMAVMLVRAYEVAAKGQKLQADSSSSFTDANKVSSWAIEAVQAAASARLLNGTGDGEFQPTLWTNRAETAQALANLLGLLQ
ncbi:S-layer homology domain-containing protein [Paenibacillus radicis (ex Xue et al. 2023)]|uniref:S-layer homology domain-containing protein n=1 Tax=Paenibacillus radicis (ex Xue et al. 2023) TaxID=2972489 RepID=A0ABT1Y9T7_9BACL|nr:S-layer homology domain-containing protein [Paenibacillus radicis (ex Xue et al. 2023)]MCR8629950.1 S-layer homology domain-containing protein [Paenibacillus radicis (ex Xue et al. 2023)]